MRAILFCVAAGAASWAVAADDWLPTVPTGSTTVELSPFVSGLGGSFSGVDQYFGSKLTPIPDGSGRNVISTFGGLLRVVDSSGAFLDSPLGGPYLNTLTPETEIGPFAYGVTSVAFHPDFTDPGAAGYGRLYTLETEAAKTNPADYDFVPAIGSLNQHAAVLAEYTVDPAALGDNRLFASGVNQNVTRRELFVAQEPDNEHNFGDLAFDSDGLLYISAGDGFFEFTGGVNAEAFNAQSLESVLGKVLRIDPTGNNSANGQYGVPTGPGGNFFANDGDANTLGEIFSYGHRNPYRLGYDPVTDAVYVGEVGHFNIEEVNRAENGANYGWPNLEGTFLINPADGFDLTPDVDGNNNGIGDFSEANGLTEPLFQYDHQDGASLTGGAVYRGTQIPELQGKYVFADFQGGDFAGPRLFAGDPATGQFEALQLTSGSEPLSGPISIDVGADNELYIVQLDGQVLSLGAAPPPPPPSAERIVDGSFEEGPSSIANWSTFNDDGTNIVVNDEQARDGSFSLEMSGGFDFSGAFQGIRIEGGDTVKASIESLVTAAETLAGSADSVELKVELYSQFGAAIFSEFFLGQTIVTLADASSPTDVWQQHEVIVETPANAVEARFTLIYLEPGVPGGSVHLDLASLLVLLDADFNADGFVDGLDIAAWEAGFGTPSGATRSDGDADGDGDVDLADLLRVQEQFGQFAPPAVAAAAAAVPEPGGVVLGLLAVVGLLNRRGR